MIRLLRISGAALALAIAGVVVVRRWRALEREISEL